MSSGICIAEAVPCQAFDSNNFLQVWCCDRFLWRTVAILLPFRSIAFTRLAGCAARPARSFASSMRGSPSACEGRIGRGSGPRFGRRVGAAPVAARSMLVLRMLVLALVIALVLVPVLTKVPVLVLPTTTSTTNYDRRSA